MPLLGLLSLVLQIYFAVHAYRSGRGQFWLFIILMVPGLGWIIYFLAEVLPEILHGTAGNAAKAKIAKALDPDKEYRDAQYAVQTAPTVNNRIRFAQALMGRREYDAVIALLQPALTSHFADDPMLLEGLAYAYFYKADYKNAQFYIQKIYDQEERRPKDYIRLLRARVYQESGETEKARDELTQLVESFSGEEARVALAQLQEKTGNKPAALAIYQDIVNRTRNMPPHYQKTQSEWIDIAKAALARG